MYLKSAVAGHPLDQQVAGQRAPSLAHMHTSGSAGGAVPAQAPVALLPGSLSEPAGAVRVGSSSNLVAQPYPVGSSAALAAAGGTGQAGFNTAAAQSAARAGNVHGL